MALAKRGIALQLQKRIDIDAQRRRRKSGLNAPQDKASSRKSTADSKGTVPSANYRRRLIQLRREALEHLEAAQAIYRQRPNHHGSGTVYLNAAYIHLDNGDFQRAEEEVGFGLRIGRPEARLHSDGAGSHPAVHDQNAKVEEEIGGGSDPGNHARRALNFSQEAIELAKHTQHHLLLAYRLSLAGADAVQFIFRQP